MIEILLLVHITGGLVALVCSLMAVSSKKGSNFHRKVGRIYAIGMATIGVTAIPMAIISEKMFLFLIALFSSERGMAPARQELPLRRPIPTQRENPQISVDAPLG